MLRESMTRWTEGHVHLALRTWIKADGWNLVAGEFPGGTDHELHPLNVVDPKVARDQSPDPRRHSAGELIPDLVAIKERNLLICEAKLGFDLADQKKLQTLLGERRNDLLLALQKFSDERRFPAISSPEMLNIIPALVYCKPSGAPEPIDPFVHVEILGRTSARLVVSPAARELVL
jgi:hypothetical protein